MNAERTDRLPVLDRLRPNERVPSSAVMLEGPERIPTVVAALTQQFEVIAWVEKTQATRPLPLR